MFGRRSRSTSTADPREPALAPATELGSLLCDLREVAVWTAHSRGWQDQGVFLLRTGEDHWHLVEFTARICTDLVPRLRALPGFDSSLLLELIGSRTPRFVQLWTRPAGDPPRPVVPPQRGPSEPTGRQP